jgi:hypothetical protein
MMGWSQVPPERSRHHDGPGGVDGKGYEQQLESHLAAQPLHLHHGVVVDQVDPLIDGVEALVAPAVLVGEPFAQRLSSGLDLVRFERADTVIVISPSRWTCVARAVGRSIRNHGADIQAEGCRERIQLSFYRWIWNYERDSHPRLDAALGRHDHLKVLELTSRTAMMSFLDTVGLWGC